MSRSQPQLKLEPRPRRRVLKPLDPNVITATGYEEFMSVIQRQHRGELEIHSLEFTARNAVVRFRVKFIKKGLT